MASIDLSTTYLGLRLANPFMAGASPLADHLDTVRRLEDAGCAAIVLHSLFEEQITERKSGRIHQMDPLDPQFAAVASYFPKPEHYAFTPDAYLEHLRRVKAAVRIPVIGSLNGTTPAASLKFAQLIRTSWCRRDRAQHVRGHHRRESVRAGRRVPAARSATTAMKSAWVTTCTLVTARACGRRCRHVMLRGFRQRLLALDVTAGTTGNNSLLEWARPSAVTGVL